MNLELYKQMINDSQAIFFDIFDTIVYRKNCPDYNKSLWCESIKRIYNLKIKLDKLIKYRNELEVKLRKSNKKKGFAAEFNYNEFLKCFYKKFKISVTEDEFIKFATQVEIDIEFNSQFIFLDTLQVLKYAKKLNKKIFCISDMYLTKDMLNELFKRHNILGYIDEIYVSSELLLNKIEGTIYNYVRQQNPKLNFEKCIMFGDNYEYDYKNAVSAGLNGVFVDRNYLYGHYSKIKDDCVNYRFVAKLDNIRSYYESFFDELYNYEQIKNICFEIYKSNIKIVKYNEKDSRVILRLKKLQNELFLHKKVEFVVKKDSNISIDDNVINFLDKKYLLKDIDEDDACFDEIVKYLANKVYDGSKFCFKSKNSNLHSDEIPIDNLKELGKQYSPAFKDFISWILNDIKSKKINKIYFFTREGEFFKEIFDKLNNDSHIKSYLLEVSRVATFFPSLSRIDCNELERLWSQYSIQSLNSLFKSLNLNVEKYLDLIIKHDLDLNGEIILPQFNINLNELFNDKDFISDVTKDLDESRELLKNYFKTKSFTSKLKEVAIVDIGWRGTIQDNICHIYPDTDIYGYYFGLEKFLNPQPKNAYKFGYINQYYGKEKVLGDITPFEMLCNSCNGSTIGYKRDKDTVKAIRKIDDIENRSYYNCTKYIQEGVLNSVCNKDIDTSKAFDEIINIIYNPNKFVASTYFQLKHNEEFGLGEYVSKKAYITKRDIIRGIYKYDAQLSLMYKLNQTSWPHGYLVANNLTKYANKLPLKVVNEFDSVKVKKKIAWIMPDLLDGSGGHRTIISNANYLVTKGYQCDLYFNEDYISTADQMYKKITNYFGECKCQVYVGLRLRCDYDMIFATYSVITPEIVKNSNCKNKMYFVQDFEPWFNAMGDGYISKENTYMEDFRMVSIGNWLVHKISSEYNGKITSFPFCADLNIYKPIPIEKEEAVCFIFQPDKPRRCVELGLRALKIVKAIKPNLKIYLYGSRQEYYVDFEHENLKIISLQECNKLYNKCKVGLCISSSNPSRIPFEMMASGLPVVDVYRDNNLYDMPDGGVTLAYSTPQSIATAILNLLDDENLAAKKSKFGVEYMKKYDINEGYRIFGETVDMIFEGNDQVNEFVAQKIYNAKPFPVRNDVKNFEFILDYRPIYHESTDYLRSLVQKKKKIKSIISLRTFLNFIKRIIKKILSIIKKIVKRIIRVFKLR